MPEQPQQIQIPPGHVVMTTHGFVRQESVQCWSELRAFTERMGLHNIKWTMMPGALPEKTRNEAVRGMLREGAGWLLQIDADMTFPADALVAEPNNRPGLLQVAYGLMPHVDAIGALCPLRGELALGTVDSGTGTWEAEWYPGSGIVEVIRTGAAFILVKRHVFEAMKDPWFRMRVPARPIDFMAEIDNYARMRFNGENPFRGQPDQYWERLEKCATDDPSIVVENFVPVEVGEDSSWCDRMRNAGFRLFVDTDIPCGHVDTRVLDWTQHKRSMDDARKWQRLASGLLA